MSLEAMKMALETLERLDRWLALRYGNELTPPEREVVKALRQAIEQAEKQEPAGEVYGWHGYGVGQPLCRFNVTEADMPVGSLLYTSPPQRQPLTLDEVKEFLK